MYKSRSVFVNFRPVYLTNCDPYATLAKPTRPESITEKIYNNKTQRIYVEYREITHTLRIEYLLLRIINYPLLSLIKLTLLRI